MLVKFNIVSALIIVFMLYASMALCTLFVWITYVTEGNSFTGTIPTDIFSFPSLEDLNLGKYISIKVYNVSFVFVHAQLMVSFVWSANIFFS